MNTNKALRLIEETLNKVTDQKVSEVMPKILTLSKIFEDSTFEKWVSLETSGYFNTNPALSDDVMVPDYRKVPGQYKDRFNRPLIIEDPDIANILNNYALREGVSELESIVQRSGLHSFSNQYAISQIKQKFDVEVNKFVFNSNSINSILSVIKDKVISWLIDKQKEFASQTNRISLSSEFSLELSSLHPIVRNAAGNLYKDGHYRQAILDTYIALVTAVKNKSGKHDIDNTPLMQSVFLSFNPIIQISTDTDEQKGFMWLFSGAVMGIRNPKAHKLIDQNDPVRALEWLSFASVLLRVLDDSQIMADATP
mgnify:CR=1 FL=1